MSPTAFNLASNLYIKDVIGIRQAVEKVQSAFRSGGVDVNLRVASASLRNLDELNAKVAVLRRNLSDAQGAAGAGQLSSIGRGSAANLNTLRQSLGGVGTTLKSVNATAAEGVNVFEKYGEVTGLAARRFLAFSIGAGAIAKFVQGIRSGIGEALEFERLMIKLNQVSGDTPDKIQGVKDEITRLSTTMGVASKELADVSVTLRQAGLSAKETQEALQPISMASLAANFGSMKEITEGAIAVMRQFKIESGQLGEALGAMNAVAAGFAVEGKDLIVVAQKAGGAFAATGGSLNELLGIFTAVRATTRESADTIASGLRTIFSRIQRNSTVEALKDLGINLRRTREEAEQLGNLNLQDQFVGTFESFRRISEGLSSIRPTDPRYAAILNELGGDRQISKLIPAIREYATAQEAFNVAKAGEVSLQIAAAKAQDGTLVKLTKIREEYLGLFRTITDSSGFKALADNLISVAGGFAKMLDFAKPLLPVLATLAAVKLAEGLIGFGAKATASLTYAKPNPVVSNGATSRLRFNKGGIVPGVGDTDSVDAVLPGGSFVLNKKATQRLATGGTPVKLTPGEQVYMPEEAKRIGYGRLAAANAGREKLAFGDRPTGSNAREDFLQAFNARKLQYANLDDVKTVGEVDQQFVSTEDALRLSGVPRGFRVHVSSLSNGILIQPAFKNKLPFDDVSFERRVTNENGKLVVHNEKLFVRANQQNNGLATGFYARQIAAGLTHHAPVTYKMHAATPIGDKSPGSKVWPIKFGIPGKARGSVAEMLLKNNHLEGDDVELANRFLTYISKNDNIQDLLDEPWGVSAWSKFGAGFHSSFTPNNEKVLRKLTDRLRSNKNVFTFGGVAKSSSEQLGLRPRTPNEQRGFAPSPNKQGMLWSDAERFATGGKSKKQKKEVGISWSSGFSFADSEPDVTTKPAKVKKKGKKADVNAFGLDDSDFFDDSLLAGLFDDPETDYNNYVTGRKAAKKPANYKPIRARQQNELTEAGTKTIREYAGSLHYPLNRFLRAGIVDSDSGRHGVKADTQEQLQEKAALLTVALKQKRLKDVIPENQILTRHVHGSGIIAISKQLGANVYSKEAVGKTILEKGFTSTSLGDGDPGTFGEHKILIKPNLKRHGLEVDETLSNQYREQEILLQRGARFKILSQDEKAKTIYLQQLAAGDVVRKKLADGTTDGPLVITGKHGTVNIPTLKEMLSYGWIKKNEYDGWVFQSGNKNAATMTPEQAYKLFQQNVKYNLNDNNKNNLNEVFKYYNQDFYQYVKNGVKPTASNGGVSNTKFWGQGKPLVRRDSVKAIKSIADSIHETVPQDNPFVLLGRDLWPAVPVLREVHKRNAQYFVWSRPQGSIAKDSTITNEIDKATAATWQKEVHPESFVFDTGYAGSIFNAIKNNYAPKHGDTQLDRSKMLLFSSTGDYKEVGSRENLSRNDIVADVEHLEKLNPRGASYSPAGSLIYKRGDKKDSGFRKRSVSEVIAANQELLLELGLSEDAAKRYAKFTGGTPQERLGLPNKEQLAEHYARVARARGKFAAGGAASLPRKHPSFHDTKKTPHEHVPLSSGRIAPQKFSGGDSARHLTGMDEIDAYARTLPDFESIFKKRYKGNVQNYGEALLTHYAGQGIIADTFISKKRTENAKLGDKESMWKAYEYMNSLSEDNQNPYRHFRSNNRKINKYVREGSTGNHQFDSTISGLDKIFDATKLPADLKLFRGLHVPAASDNLAKVMPGHVLNNLGFQYTSLDKSVSEGYATTNLGNPLDDSVRKYLLTILADKGTPAIFPNRPNKEIILGRRTGLEILDRQENDGLVNLLARTRFAAGGPLRGREPGSLKKILSAGMLGLSMYVGGVQSEDAVEVLQRQRVDNVKDRDEAERQAAGKQRKIKKAAGGRLGIAAGGRPDDLEPVVFDRQGQARRVDVKKPAGLDAEHSRLQRAQIEKPGSQEAGNTQYIHSLLNKPPVAAGVGWIKSLAVERQVRSANKRAAGGDMRNEFLQAFRNRKLEYAALKDSTVTGENYKPIIPLEDALRLSGIPKGFRPQLDILPDGSISVQNNLLSGLFDSTSPYDDVNFRRTISNKDGKLRVDNNLLKVNKGSRNKGIATGFYTRQIATGLEYQKPIEYELDAFGLDEKNPGSKVWPIAFGIPGKARVDSAASNLDRVFTSNDDFELAKKFHEYVKKNNNIQDLLEEPWGKDAWLKFGHGFTTKYGPTDGKILSKLTAKLRSPKAVFAAGDRVRSRPRISEDMPVEEFVREWSKWKPTKYLPSPNLFAKATKTWNAEDADLAAVVAGVKPAAYLQSNEKGEYHEQLLELAKKRGLDVTPRFVDYPKNSLVVGKSDNVKSIVDIVRRADEGEEVPDFAQTLGLSLGYPDKAIKEFHARVNRITSGENVDHPLEIIKKRLEKLRSRRAHGDLVKLPRSQRLSLKDALANIQERPDLAGGSTARKAGRPYAKELARLALEGTGALKYIPKGSQFLGSGIIGLAYKTPQGDVIRVQPTGEAALKQAQKHRPDVDEVFLSPRRLNDPDILQPTSSKLLRNKKTAVSIERLPLVESIENPSEGWAAIDRLNVQLASRNLHFEDQKISNVGKVAGRYVVSDPGAVLTNEEFLAREERLKAQNRLVVQKHLEKTLANPTPADVGNDAPTLLERVRRQSLDSPTLKQQTKVARFAEGGIVANEQGMLSFVEPKKQKRLGYANGDFLSTPQAMLWGMPKNQKILSNISGPPQAKLVHFGSGLEESLGGYRGHSPLIGHKESRKRYATGGRDYEAEIKRSVLAQGFSDINESNINELYRLRRPVYDSDSPDAHGNMRLHNIYINSLSRAYNETQDGDLKRRIAARIGIAGGRLGVGVDYNENPYGEVSRSYGITRRGLTRSRYHSIGNVSGTDFGLSARATREVERVRRERGPVDLFDDSNRDFLFAEKRVEPNQEKFASYQQVVKQHFPGVNPSGLSTELKHGDRLVQLKYVPGDNDAVRVDFRKVDGGYTDNEKHLESGSLDFLRKLQSFAKDLSAGGLGIIAQGSTDKRNKIYKKGLRAAGLRDTGDGLYQKLMLGGFADRKHYATGGTVNRSGLIPGSGDTDSVPLDLPAGSFVIRKSSVKSIGPKKLAELSSGGDSPADGATVPALLMPQEWVFNPQDTARIGAATLHRMNTMGRLPFRSGGLVGGRIGFASGNKVESAEVKLTDISKEDNPQIYTDVESSVKKLSGSLAKVVKSVEDVGTVMVRFSDSGPVFERVVKSTAELNKVIEEEAKKQKQAAPAKKDSVLSSLSPAQAKVYMQHEPKIERAIGKAANGADPSGGLYDAGSTALAYAIKGHKQKQLEAGEKVSYKDFKPYSYIERAISQKAGRLADGKAGKTESTDPTILNESHSARYAEELAEPLPTTEHGFEDILASNKTTYRKAQDAAKRAGVSAKGSQSDILDRLAESQAPKHLQQPQQAVTNRESAVSRLKALGVDVQGGISSPLSDDVLSGLVPVAERVPANIRTLLESAGNRVTVSPDKLKSIPAFRNVKLSDDSVDGASLPTGSAISGFAAFTDSRGYGRPDSELYGRATLLHERGHDVDKAIGGVFRKKGLIKEERFSSTPEYLALHEATAKAVLPGIKDETGRKRLLADPKESFAEGFNRYVYDDKQRASLPADTQKYFSGLVARADKLVEQPTAVGTKAQLGPLEEAGKFARTTPVPTRNYNISRGAAYFGQENEQYQSSPLIARKGYQSYFGKEKKPVIATDIRSLLATEKLAGVNRSPAEVLRRQSANETVLSAAEMQNLLGDSPAAVATNATVAATKVSPASQVPAHSLPARPVALQPGSQTATPITSPAHSPTAGAANLPTTGGANQSAASATKIPVHALPTRPAALQTRVLPPGAATIPLSPQNQATASPAANNARQGVVPLAASAPTQTTTASGGQPPAPPKPKAPGAAGDEEPEKKQRKAKLPEDVSGIFRSLVQEITSLVGAIKKVRGDLTTSGDEGSARRPRKTGQAGADDFESGGIGRNKLLDSLGVKRQSPAAFASGLPGNGLPESGLASSGLGSNKLLDSLAGPPLPDTTAEKAKAKKQVEIAKAEAKQRKDEEKTRQAAQAVLSAKTITPPAKSLQVVDDSQRIDSLRASIIERHENRPAVSAKGWPDGMSSTSTNGWPGGKLPGWDSLSASAGKWPGGMLPPPAATAKQWPGGMLPEPAMSANVWADGMLPAQGMSVRGWPGGRLPTWASLSASSATANVWPGSMSPTSTSSPTPAVSAQRWPIAMRSAFAFDVPDANGLVQDKNRGLVDIATTNKTRDRIQARGGENVLSQQSQQAIKARALYEEETRVAREFISAERKAVQALHPTIRAYEAQKIAVENYNQKIAEGKEKIVRDDKGRILGSESTVRALEAKGQVAPGAGIVARGTNAVSSFYSNVSDRAAAIGERARGLPGVSGAGKLFSGLRNYAEKFQGSGIGSGALFALPLLTGQFEQHIGGTADSAVTRGETGKGYLPDGRYSTGKALSGSVQGAASYGIGAAAIGSVIPGVGSAVAGIIGGSFGVVKGFVDALHEAEKELRDVKLAKALNDFAQNLSAYAQAGNQANPAAVSLLSTSLADTRKLGDDEARKESSGLFTSFDYQKFATLRQSNLRKRLGQSLPDITQSLNRQVEEAAHRSPNDRPANITSRVFGGGVNLDLLRTISEVRNVSLKQATDEFKKVIEQAQKSRRVEDAGQAARVGEERNVSTFGRFLASIQSASDSLVKLQTNAQALSTVFGSSLEPSRVSFGAERLNNLGLGRGDTGVFETLGLIRNVGNAAGSDQGARLFQAGSVATQLSQILPGILANAAAANPTDEESFGTRVRNELTRVVGGDQAVRQNQQLGYAINTVISSLNNMTRSGGLDQIYRSLQVDSTRLSSQLLSSYSDPLREYGQNIARLLEERSNAFINSLTQLTERTRAVGETYDRLAQAQVGTVRASADIQDVRSLASPGSSALRLPLQQLQFAGQYQQERLTGFQGQAANDPVAIGRALRRVQDDIQTAAQRQREIALETGGQGPRYEQAAQSLLNLQTRAQNLGRALSTLADSTTRNSLIQERLSVISRERSARTSYASRFLQSSPEEQVSLNRGVGLLMNANQRGNLSGFTQDQVRSILETAQGHFGSVRLPALGNETGETIANRLIAATPGYGGFIQGNPQQANEERQLQDQLISNMQTAERALEQSATAQQTNIQFLVSNLHEQQTTFFANLRQYLTEDRVNRLQVRQGELGEQTGRLQRLGGQATLLGRVGITDDRRLTTARGAEQSFRTFFDTQQRITDAGRISDTAPEAAVGLGNYLGVRRPQELRQFVRGGDAENVTQGISSFLTGNPSLSGLTPSQQTNIISRTQRLAVNAPNRGEAGQGNTESTQVRSFVDFLRPLLLQSIRTELGGGQGTALADDFRRRGEAQGTLNRLGFSTDGLQGIVQSGQSQRFLESLTAFDNAANQLSTLPVRLQQINQQFAEVAEEIGRVRVELNRGAAPRAAGGVIERYHTGGVVSGRLGRREVPIIAEQNEMVVNRTSTKANMPLLQAINDAKGPLALSRGGVAQYLEVGGAAQPSLLRRFGRGLLNVIHPRNGQAVASWVANRATGNNPLPASNNSGVGRLELNVASVDDALNQRNLANAFQRPATDAPFTNAVGQVARDRTANLSHNALQAYTRSISSGASREASLALAEHLNQLPAETQRSYIRATARGVASQEALQLATQQASQIARSNLLVGRPPGTIPTTTPTIPVPTRPVVPPTPTPGVAAAQVNVSTAPNATTPPVVNSVPRTATTPPPATTVTEPFASTPAARSTVRPTGTVVFEAPPVGPAPPGSIEAFAEAEARAFRARPNEVAGRASTFPESTAPRMGSRTAPAPAVSPSSGGFLNNLRNLNVRNLVGSGLQTTSRLLTSAAQGFVIGEAIRQPFIQAGNLSTPQATRELLGGQQGGFTGFNPISDTFAQSDNVAVRAASYLTPVVEAPLLGAADAVQRIFTGRANIDDNAQARVLQRQELASADFAAQQRLERLNDYVTRRIPEFIAEKRQALDATGYATAPPQDYPAWESRLGLLAREWFHPTAPFEYNTPEGPRPTLDQGLTQIRRVSGFEDVPAMARAANVLHLMYGEYRGFADALRWADTTESVTPEVSAVRSRLAQPRQFFFNPNAESQIAAVERQFNEFRGRQIDERDAATDYRWLFRGDINVGGFPASTRRTLESVGMQRLAEIGLRLEASEARETEASATDEQRSFILRLREEQANIILARLRGRGLAGNVIGAASQENPGWAGILRQYVAATPFHSLPEELRDHAGEAREQQQEQDDVNRERFWRNLWTTRMQPAEFEPARRLLDNQYLLGKVVPGGPEFRNRDRLDFPEEYFNYRGDPVAAEKLEIRQRQAHLLEQAGVINSTNPNHDLRVSEEEYAGSLSTVTRLANTFLEPRPLSLDEYLRAAGLPRLEEDADHQRLTRTLGPNSEGIRLGAEIRSEQRQRRIRELMEAAGKNKFTARRVQPEELELAVTRATGGPVYRSGGGHVGHSPIGFPAGERPDPAIFRPSGTDSVPARLEAGSFVVSRKGVQKNRGILQSLLQQPQAYDNGGLVNAMLTPGEIVAPPHVARGNMSLLQRINSGEAVYRSEGGSIGVVSPGSFGDALAGAVSSTLGASLSDITFPANAAAESGMKGEKGDIGKLPLDGSGDFKKIFSGHMVESTKLSERGSRDSHYLQKNFFSHLGGSQGKFFNDLHRLFTMGSRANVTDDSRGRSIHVLNTLAPRYFSAGGFVGGGQISAPVLFQPVKNDKVPAMLEVGEAVISRKQAQANRGLIDAINKGNGAVPFYVGGSVRQPRYYARGTSCVEPIYAALGEFIQPQPRVLGELREQGLFAQRQDRLRRNEEEQRQRREDERRRAQENIHGPQISQRERENRRLEIEFQEQLQQQTRERAAAEQAQYVQRFNRQSALDPLGISGGLAARDNAQNAFLRDANANINFAFVPQEQLRETARQRGEEALSRNYTLGSLSSLRQRQTLARTQNNPFAAFGRSRADSSTQASLQSGTVQQRQESRDQLYRTNFVANELTNRYQNNYQQQFVQFGMNRRAMGGPILRMEHGGAVPGELHEPEDSRLAYLSSNEYVFPRQAVQNIGVPALDRIRRFASGGYVGQAQPLAAGGIATSNQSGSGIDFSSFISQLGTAFGGFATTSSQLVLGFTQFNTSSASLAQALAAFPSKISMDSTHRHEVILNGTEALAGLQDALKAMVIGEVKKNIAKLFKDIPELNVSTNLE